MERSIAIVSGEASGDLYGADLANTLKARYPQTRIGGVGGARMGESGVKIWQDSRLWGSIGVIEAFKVAPRVIYAMQVVKRQLKRQAIDLLIPIDFGAFNVPLCRWTKRQGLPVLYYIPPGSWRRDRQGKDLPFITDCIATPFPWSAEILQRMGANAHWVGHPLTQLSRPTETKAAFCDRFGLDPDRPIIGILPGSRRHEVRHLTPAFARACEQLHRKKPEVQFVLSVMPHFSPDFVQALWQSQSNLLVPMETRSIQNMIAHTDALLCCSGTATLEAALLNTPMLISYRGSSLMTMEYHLRKRRLSVSYIGLPNLILERKLCPEFLQEEVQPKVLCGLLLELLDKQEAYQTQMEGFAEIRALLGNKKSSWEVTELIDQMFLGGEE
ncbi:MAG: lipid-A-disaccharide synthase [Fimbriimonadia bacterium]|nr:lipid-A-disaccharide synthase [Fimbriimonadia bacterium]